MSQLPYIVIKMKDDQINTLTVGSLTTVTDIFGNSYTGFPVRLCPRNHPGQIHIDPAPDPARGIRVEGYIHFHPQEACKCGTIPGRLEQNPPDENPCSCPPITKPHEHCGTCHGVKIQISC